MLALFTPQQVRAMDQRAFARGVPSLALMEQAAGHLARAVVAAGGHGYGLRVGILCGKGNNGGDGLAAARRLLAWGAAPIVHLVAEDASGDAEVQLRRWRATGGRVVETPEEAVRGADVVVDCLLGTGATGAPRPPYDAAIVALNAVNAPVVACDLPSGVDAGTGAVPGVAVRADVTVTLGAHKRGLWLWPARGHCGRLVLGDLGIVTDEDVPAAAVLERVDVGRLVPPPAPEAHKRTRGVVLVIAGAPGMSGAAVLVARGALAAGAGLVTVASGAREVVASAVPEALTVALPSDDPERALDLLRPQLAAADAVAVGPGLGHDAPAVALVERLLAEVEAPLVLDADGLNCFRHRGDALTKHTSRLLVATPHANELRRLVGEDVWGRRVLAVPEYARAWAAVLVAKGPGTLIAAPDERVWINATGGPALATGGTGDVLTGVLAALLAERADPEVVAAGVHLHGLAGDLAAARSAVRSVTALDVAAAVPLALRMVEQAA